MIFAASRSILPARWRSAGPTVSVMGFFGLKMLVGVALITVSARQLPVSGFAVFSQLFLFLSLISTIAAGGAQSGLSRQVAIAKNAGQEAVAMRAGLRLWAIWGLVILIGAVVGQNAISELLMGNVGAREPVAYLGLLAVLAGIGQLHCARLTGRGEVVRAMLLQGAGLLLGGAICVERLAAGYAEESVLGYAVGGLIPTTAFGIDYLRGRANIAGPADEVRTETATLMRFSVSFLLVAIILPSTLFLLRYLYRAEFGAEALGYWLMANRVSDISTQLIGLYLGQVFLPAIARAAPGPDSVRLMLRTTGLGMSITALGLLLFLLLRDPVTSIVLGTAYRPAIPYIAGYLVGDVLRVAGNVALFTALGRGHLRIYVALEFAYAATVGITISVLIMQGWRDAPFYGYATAHLLNFLAIAALLKRFARLKPQHLKEFPAVSNPVVDEL